MGPDYHRAFACCMRRLEVLQSGGVHHARQFGRTHGRQGERVPVVQRAVLKDGTNLVLRWLATKHMAQVSRTASLASVAVRYHTPPARKQAARPCAEELRAPQGCCAQRPDDQPRRTDQGLGTGCGAVVRVVSCTSSAWGHM